MKVLLLTFLVYAVGVNGQANLLNRLVSQSLVSAKSFWCFQMLGFDYALETDLNGDTWIARDKYLRRYLNGQFKERYCAPGTWFATNPSCICDTRIPDPDFGNTDRCFTITGDFQSSTQFQNIQRGSVNTQGAYVAGFEGLRMTTDGCFGSNATTYRRLPLFNGNSLSRNSLDVTVGFSLPSGINVPAARQFQLLSTSPCAEDNRPASLSITYTTGDPNNVGVRPRLTATFMLNGRNGGVFTTENTQSITCTIPNEVVHPSSTAFNPRDSYFWDASDSGNSVRLVLNQGSVNGARIYLFNSAMNGAGNTDSTEVPTFGFCSNQVLQNPNVRFGTNNRISPRNCPLAAGVGDSDFLICMHTIRIERDCN